MISPVNGAEAAALGCGTIITQDTVLTARRRPVRQCHHQSRRACSWRSRLVIAADNVTLDLNGHTIFNKTLTEGHANSSVEHDTGVFCHGRCSGISADAPLVLSGR